MYTIQRNYPISKWHQPETSDFLKISVVNTECVHVHSVCKNTGNLLVELLMINLHLHCTAVQSIALGQWFQLSPNNLFLTLCAISLLWHCNVETRIYVAVNRKKNTSLSL